MCSPTGRGGKPLNKNDEVGWGVLFSKYLLTDVAVVWQCKYCLIHPKSLFLTPLSARMDMMAGTEAAWKASSREGKIATACLPSKLQLKVEKVSVVSMLRRKACKHSKRKERILSIVLMWQRNSDKG